MKNSCYDLKERITREIIYFVRRHRTFLYLVFFRELPSIFYHVQVRVKGFEIYSSQSSTKRATGPLRPRFRG